MAMFPAEDAFKVSDRVLERNRYVPRKWTQKELDAALSSPFNARKKIVQCEKDITSDSNRNYEKESHTEVKDDMILSSEISENAPSASQFTRKLSDIDERLTKLEENMTAEKRGICDDSTTSVNELERTKNSEVAVKLNDEQFKTYPTKDAIESETTTASDFVSFLNCCLQCIFNIDTFKDKISGILYSKSYTPLASELKDFLNVFEQLNSSGERQLHSREEFSTLFDNISLQSNSCGEALALLLEAIIKDLDYCQGKNEFRSLIQGKFCHSRLCEQCETVVREYESFTFLDPCSTSQLTQKSQQITINFISYDAERVCKISIYEVPISTDERMADLKEKLEKIIPGNLIEASPIEIGAVKAHSVTEIYEDTESLHVVSTLDPNSSLCAFSVINGASERMFKTSQKNRAERTSVDTMPYHLYFNCGLCLNDGKNQRLLMHRSCGGMVCQDCLDEISKTSQDWESSTCPVCERPIDLTKDICPTNFNAETDQADVPCIILFRTDGRQKNTTAKLFGAPVLLNVAQETTGYHLYRVIGSILPTKLPLKSKTSFTIHMVTKHGNRCTTCTTPSCTGCLVKINDTITLQPFTYLVVHFEKLTEKWREVFGGRMLSINGNNSNVSKAQTLFDSILRSCAESSPSSEGLCPKCYQVMSKTVTSISNFPQLLIIHLNRQFAGRGLPPHMSVADIARFVTVERSNMATTGDSGQGLTYQLSAAVLQEGDGVSLQPKYKSFISGRQQATWLKQTGTDKNETDPNHLYLSSDDVLFYEPVKQPTKLPCYPQKITGAADRDGTEKDLQLGGSSRHAKSNFGPTTTDHGRKRKSRKSQTISRPAEADKLEPGEYRFGKEGIHKEIYPLRNASMAYGSCYSLGEIKNPGHLKPFAANEFHDIDTISPISVTDSALESARLRETRNLITAVKMEDAYGIVCTLKKSADPCLLVNDVTALHLAAGSKSDQRSSILTYLLKYANDVNVATSDGTTPIHVAAAWGHQDAVEILLRHGGDPFERTDIEGNSAFDLASKDCSIFLQSVHNIDPNSTRIVGFPAGPRKPKPTRGRDFQEKQRLEDIVRSNMTLPSFVELDGTTQSSVQRRRRWLQRLRSFHRRSTGILRNLRKVGAKRRRSRIGVMVTDASGEISKNQRSTSK